VLTDAKDRIITQRAHPRMALVRAGSLDGGAILVSAPGREPLAVPVPGPAGTTTVEIWNDRVEGVLAGVTADAWFSDFPGLPVRLAHLDAPATRRPVDPRFERPGGTVGFADGYPLFVTTLASLDALNALIARGDRPAEGPLPMNRFRPNIVVGGHRRLGRGRLVPDRRRRGRPARRQDVRALCRDHHRPDDGRARQGAAAHPRTSPPFRRPAGLRAESRTGVPRLGARGRPGAHPRTGLRPELRPGNTRTGHSR
jgi:hypothetical protein